MISSFAESLSGSQNTPFPFIKIEISCGENETVQRFRGTYLINTKFTHRYVDLFTTTQKGK
jgi:hypothetical protein